MHPVKKGGIPVGRDQIFGGDVGHGTTTRHELQRALAFHGVEAEIAGKRGDGGSRAFQRCEDKAGDSIGKAYCRTSGWLH